MIQIVGLRATRGAVYPAGKKVVVQSVEDIFRKNEAILKEFPEDERKNLFYTVAHHRGIDTAENPVRTASSFERQECIAFDIDGVTEGKDSHPIYCAAVAGVLKLSPEEITCVFTGGGFHFVVFLHKPITNAREMTELKPHYQEICEQITECLELANLTGKADPVIFEPARILRLPGTLNEKPDRQTKLCEIVRYRDIRHDWSPQLVSGIDVKSVGSLPPQEARHQFPKPDVREIFSPQMGCRIIQWAMGHLQELHEPQIFDLFSILGAMPDTPDIMVPGTGEVFTPRQCAKFIFERATASSSLRRKQFDRYFETCGRYGVRRCDTLSVNFAHLCAGQCTECPWMGKIQTPLAIKSPDHIGSEGNGFWSLDRKGGYKHPHYNDLLQVFKREHSYCIDSRNTNPWVWDGRRYHPLSELYAKSWVEAKLTPRDPLREAHRSEFWAKLKANQVLSEQQAEWLLEKSTSNKMNLQNGVLDIMTGEFVEHSPKVGFRTVLPYPYQPDAEADFFLEWLDDLALGKESVVEAMLDVMAWCLCSGYDDHCFVLLIGSGANGKSTYLTLLREVLGGEAVSSISMDQLAENRFMVAQLDGKMANLSEESGRIKVGHQELAVLKNLSSGGRMQVEMKGKDSYTMTNQAKLVFAMNNIPHFSECTPAIMRRLVVVPFNKSIKIPDSSFPEKLRANIPGILNLLVTRIREKVRAEGSFKVSRSSETENMVRTIFMSGSPFLTWMETCIRVGVDIPKDKHLDQKVAYTLYREWLKENGYSLALTMNYGDFVNEFVSRATVYGVKTNTTRMIDGRSLAVFEHCEVV